MKSILKIVKDIYYDAKFNLKNDRKYLVEKYTEVFGVKPNFDAPTTFNEKLHWINLYDRDLTKTVLTDKFSVRKIVAMTIGEQYLIPLHQHTSLPSEVTINTLPDTPVIIKTNHASGIIYIIKDKNNHDFAEMQNDLALRLKNNFYFNLREWQYKHIQPKVLVEELLLTEDEQIPEDYKIHCFNGEPTFIQVDISRFSEHDRSIFDINWNLLDIGYKYPKGGNLERPNSLNEMIKVAEKLSSQFNYCRVDLYSVSDKVYFGEITFSPEGGLARFSPTSVDAEWGKLLKL